MRNAILFTCVVSLAGCSQPPTPTEPVAPVQRIVQPAQPATPSIRNQAFRVRAEFLGKVDVTFHIQINGIDVGTFNADARNDVTALVHPGANTVHVSWNADKKVPKDDRAQLYVESRRTDQEDWNVVYSREVNSLTESTQGDGTFAVPIH